MDGHDILPLFGLSSFPSLESLTMSNYESFYDRLSGFFCADTYFVSLRSSFRHGVVNGWSPIPSHLSFIGSSDDYLRNGFLGRSSSVLLKSQTNETELWLRFRTTARDAKTSFGFEDDCFFYELNALRTRKPSLEQYLIKRK